MYSRNSLKDLMKKWRLQSSSRRRRSYSTKRKRLSMRPLTAEWSS